MVSFPTLLTFCSVAVAVSALPSTRLSKRQSTNTTTVTTSNTGFVDGYFYSFWDQVNGPATMEIGNGSYNLTWTSDTIDIVAGLGWNPGSAQVINYSGTFETDANAYLAVYGWTTNPLVEYYILESYGDYNPSSGLAVLGTVTTDGETYKIYRTVRTNDPSIEGTQTFNQFWSVRNTKRVGGTVTTGNHFNAWNSLGMTLGTFNYQILATEGYMSDGNSSITVTSGGPIVGEYGQCGGEGWTGGTTCYEPYVCTPQAGNPYYSQCLASPAAAVSTTTVAEYGQCGGQGWTGLTQCAPPNTCQVVNTYYSQCLPGVAVNPNVITNSSTGFIDGYFYSFWDQVDGPATMEIGNGSYNLTWTSDTIDIVAGLGWNPGSAQVINYSGTFETDANAYLAVYGWTTNPLVEYYILESYGDYNPSSGLAVLGNVTSDGETYQIYRTVRENDPSIEGTATFNQFWSVRNTKRVGGTVTTANHFNAWAALNMTLGTFNYQILATEGYKSDGSSSITVSSGNIISQYGQCGGLNWTGGSVCAAPYTCTPQAGNGMSKPYSQVGFFLTCTTTEYYSQCL
ncbi:hypothetical protein C0991_007457 [Blastosporella zonata]|nr:hypothetical protein C0991_007457 [Blastosporella zonata]